MLQSWGRATDGAKDSGRYHARYEDATVCAQMGATRSHPLLAMGALITPIWAWQNPVAWQAGVSTRLAYLFMLLLHCLDKLGFCLHTPLGVHLPLQIRWQVLDASVPGVAFANSHRTSPSHWGPYLESACPSRSHVHFSNATPIPIITAEPVNARAQLRAPPGMPTGYRLE